MESISKRLKELRISEGWKRKEFAETVLKVTDGHYKPYEEEDRVSYRPEIMNALADHYKVSLDYLYGRTDVKYETSEIGEEQLELIRKSTKGEHDKSITYD